MAKRGRPRKIKIGRPCLYKEPMVRVPHVLLDVEMIKNLKKMAKKLKVSLSQYIRMALGYHLYTIEELQKKEA